jgi:very-short-patch-repair endonuclease
MPSKAEILKKQLKDLNVERKSSPLEDWFVQCFTSVRIYNYVREYQVGNYFIDFAFPEIKFGVEADGELYHFDRKEKDKERDKFLAEQGWEIYRVNSKEAWNYKIFAYHLLNIYKKTQEDKIPPYSLLEVITHNKPEDYLKEHIRAIREKQENSMVYSYHCEDCDEFYFSNTNCKCKK